MTSKIIKKKMLEFDAKKHFTELYEEKPRKNVDVKIIMEIHAEKRQNRFKFCPRCSNLIVLNDKSDLPCYRLQCPTCPFFKPVTKRIVHTKVIPKSDDFLEGILDASKSDEHRQRTQVVCPECNHTEAFFYQMQTRSADEPMTNFYECANKQCKKNWRD